MKNRNISENLNQPSNDVCNDYLFTPEEISILNERREKRLNGESKTYTWEQAKEIIFGNKKLR